jgi:Rad3-related DNA helicase
LHFFDYFIEHSDRNIIADAPTGIGKSLIAIQIGINLERPGTVFVVTPTKDLMKQYERDYGNLKEVMLLAGKNEYKCQANPDLTAELCTHKPNAPCEHNYSKTKDSCEYSKKNQHIYGLQGCCNQLSYDACTNKNKTCITVGLSTDNMG